jgi:hypothetical protein
VDPKSPWTRRLAPLSPHHGGRHRRALKEVIVLFVLCSTFCGRHRLLPTGLHLLMLPSPCKTYSIVAIYVHGRSFCCGSD